MEDSNWRYVERSSITRYRETTTLTTGPQITTEPIDCDADDYTSDYTSEHNINVDTTLEKQPSNHIFVTNNIQNEDLGSNSGTSTSLPRSIDINLARDRNGTLGRNGGGGGPGSGCHYIPCEPASPVPSRTRSYREVEERPGGTMQRAASTADISQYECSEDGAIRLHMVSNMILLIASLLMIGTGAGLMGFYRIHMLEIVSVEFMVVPMIMTVGGAFAFFTAIFGLYATSKEDSCLLVTHATFMTLQFFILIAGVISSVRLIFFIQTGLFNADVVPDLQYYESSSWTMYKWDTLQREFMCCGGYSYNMGYQDWKHTMLGGQFNSVPDSCCLKISNKCGDNIFRMTDQRRLVEQINTHGCITVMQRRLEDHVVVILMVFASVGGLLAIILLLTIVLACCFANQIEKFEAEDNYYNNVNNDARDEYCQQYNAQSYTPRASRPSTPSQSRRGNTGETTC